MAGNLTHNQMLNFLDYSTAYLCALLFQCVFISFFLFFVIFLLRETLLCRNIFLKGMLWGILLTAPFLGKLKPFYEERFLYCWTDRWAFLCTGFWWIRYGYLLGMAICAGFLFSGRRRLGRLVKCMVQDTICGQKVRINELAVTPFTTGLFHPEIVIPKTFRANLEAEEIEMVLLHERTHIRLGHLWFSLWWDILQVLLWPNFLFCLGRHWFQEDLEAVCDTASICNSGKNACDYGMLLLKSMKLLETKASLSENKNGVAAFAQTRDYKNMKQRISRIADFRPYQRAEIRALCIGGMVILAGIFWQIGSHSYPHYTEAKDIVLYPDAQLTSAIVVEEEELSHALSWDKEAVFIHRTAMDQILEKYGIEEKRFVIGLGGYTKIPTMGSGGGFADVDYRGQEEELRIPYWNSERNFWIALFKQIP